MNKFLDWVITGFKYMSKKNKLYLISFYNRIYFFINTNFNLSKTYKPIIEEKTNINKKLHQNLTVLNNKNREIENDILKLSEENNSLQIKISTIQNLMTKRHD